MMGCYWCYATVASAFVELEISPNPDDLHVARRCQHDDSSLSLVIKLQPLLQVLPLAIALVRDEEGHSFPEAAEVLLDHLEQVDNRDSPYDDDNAIAALLEALGALHPSSPQVQRDLSIFKCVLHRTPT